VGLVRRYPVIE